MESFHDHGFDFNKFGFVNGSVKRLGEDEADELRQWICCSNSVKTWLLSSNSKKIAASVFQYDGSQEVWNELNERISQVNIIQFFYIKNQIHDCTQGTMSVDSYFTKLKDLWDERDVICSISSCHCGAMKEELYLTEKHKRLSKFLWD